MAIGSNKIGHTYKSEWINAINASGIYQSSNNALHDMRFIYCKTSAIDVLYLHYTMCNQSRFVIILIDCILGGGTVEVGWRWGVWGWPSWAVHFMARFPVRSTPRRLIEKPCCLQDTKSTTPEIQQRSMELIVDDKRRLICYEVKLIAQKLTTSIFYIMHKSSNMLYH